MKSFIGAILAFIIFFSNGFIGQPVLADDHTSSSQIEPYFDEFFSKQMMKNHVPGVSVIVFRDDDVLFQKGYGYAHIEHEIPINPDETVFRAASISKTMMALALLQLYDKGLIDLDKEVTTYLKKDDLLLKKEWKGLKVKHLLTHTEGFPSRELGTFTKDINDIPSIHDTLSRKLQAPAIPPGTAVTYGNMGAVVAAYLIETITGETYQTYIEKNIFNKLEMKNSTFEQNLPKQMNASLATSYTSHNGQFEPATLLYGSTPPAEGLSTTTTDMWKLMKAITNSGTDNTLLHDDTAQSMLQTQFRGHTKLPGVTHGFFEQLVGQQRAIVRDGSGFGTTSRLFYIPEKRVGYIYFQNSENEGLLQQFQASFLQYFFQKHKKLGQPTPLTKKEAESLEGYYRSVQYEHNILKVGTYFSEMILKISSNDDGTLHLKGNEQGDEPNWNGFEKETTLTQVKPQLFSRSDTEEYVAFKKVEDKVYLFSGNGTHVTYEKIAWYETPLVLLLNGIVFLAFFISILLFTFYYWVKRENMKDPLQKYLPRLMGLTATLNLLFPVLVFVLGYVAIQDGIPAIMFGIPTTVSIIIFTPIITFSIAVIMLIILMKYWHISRLPNETKIIYTFVVTVFLLYIPYVIYWRLFPGLTI